MTTTADASVVPPSAPDQTGKTVTDVSLSVTALHVTGRGLTGFAKHLRQRQLHGLAQREQALAIGPG